MFCLRYSDWRQPAALELRNVWVELQEQHHELAKELVGDAVDAGRSEIQQVNDLAVDMFYDMMKSEFILNESITSVEHQTIDEVTPKKNNAT